MLTPGYNNRFKRDVKRLKKRGKDLGKLKSALNMIIDEEELPESMRDHKLIGNFAGSRECHIEPDWLLIYAPDQAAKEVFFQRTGSHSDLF